VPSAFPQVAFSNSSSASSSDDLGTDDDFMKSFDPKAASARLIALRKSKAAYEAMLLTLVGDTSSSLLQEVDIAVKRAKGQINRAAMLQLLSSSAIAHPARGKVMRKSLKSIYDALIKLGREHVGEEILNRAAEILGIDDGKDNAAEDETQLAQPTPAKVEPEKKKKLAGKRSSAGHTVAEPAPKKPTTGRRQG
jgi:hypothetical protein